MQLCQIAVIGVFCSFSLPRPFSCSVSQSLGPGVGWLAGSGLLFLFAHSHTLTHSLTRRPREGTASITAFALHRSLPTTISFNASSSNAHFENAPTKSPLHYFRPHFRILRRHHCSLKSERTVRGSGRGHHG